MIKRKILIFSVPCVLIIPMIIYQASIYRAVGFAPNPVRVETAKFQRSISSCNLFLKSFNTTFPFVLLDERVLEQIEKDDCEKLVDGKVKVGVDVKYLENPTILTDSRLEVIFFTNDTKTDYLDLRTDRRRILPSFFDYKTFNNIIVPTNPAQFHEMWKRSTFVECLNLYIPRAGQTPYLNAKKSTESLAKLRDEMLFFGVFPFLNGGTLLGWYRECSVIPHTYDMDIAVFVEDFKVELIDHFQSNSSEFKMKRKLGKIEDSLELTVALKEGYSVNTDIFMLYTETLENGTVQNWVGGMAGDGTKYKYTYPEYDPWCSADLHGHIFWITCSPNKQLTHEYGKLWYKDHPTNKYAWNGSGKNVRKNGKWKKEEMKDVYETY